MEFRFETFNHCLFPYKAFALLCLTVTVLLSFSTAPHNSLLAPRDTF